MLGTHYTITNGCKKDVGTYTVTITFIGIYSGSYQVECEIEKTKLIVTVSDENITYGDAKPNFSVTYNGFVNSETESVLGGELTFSSEYVQYSNVGEYVVSATGYTSNNYEILSGKKLDLNKIQKRNDMWKYIEERYIVYMKNNHPEIEIPEL